MDPAVKRTLGKLWLGGLLWWSLLLRLVRGGNSSSLCQSVFQRNLMCSLANGFYEVLLQPRLSFPKFGQVSLSVCRGKCHPSTPLPLPGEGKTLHSQQWIIINVGGNVVND